MKAEVRFFDGLVNRTAKWANRAITRSGAGVGHDGALSTAPLSPRHPAIYLFVKGMLRPDMNLSVLLLL
jgi:hypothetical protein